VRNSYAVLAARLSPAELPAPPARPARPPWCGECDQATRMLGFDGDAPRPCPRCKPAAINSRASPLRLSSGRSAHATARTAVTERESRSLARQPKSALSAKYLQVRGPAAGWWGWRRSSRSVWPRRFWTGLYEGRRGTVWWAGPADSLVEGPALGPGRRGLPVACVSRCALPVGRRRGAGLGMFIGGVLNLVFGVSSASSSTARANGFR
jgi:hypothetical protein